MKKLILGVMVATMAWMGFGATTGFSVAGKVRIMPKELIGTMAGMIAHCGSGWYDGYRLTVGISDKGFQPMLQIGRKEGAWTLKAPEGVRVMPGTWTHLAATWDGEMARIYVNGKEVASGEFREPFTKAVSKNADDRTAVFAKAATYGVEYYSFERRDTMSGAQILTADEIKSMAGTAEQPTAESIAKWNTLLAASRHVHVNPTAADCADLAKAWAERMVKVEGPAPVLGEGETIPETAKTFFYVSTSGDDRAAGTKDAPFATLIRARNAIRALKQKGGLPQGGVTVFVRGGTYRMTETLVLTAEDTGTAACPILYAAYPGETPIFDGGFEVKGFKPVTDAAVLKRIPEAARPYVRVADAKAQGFAKCVPNHPYGWEVAEVYRGEPTTECYYEGKRLEPARWPDDAWLRANGGNPKKWQIQSDALPDWVWQGEEKDLMFTGYPCWKFSDVTTPVTAIDAATKTITLMPSKTGKKLYEIGKKAPFFLSHALAALNRPGEWHFDTKQGLVYLYEMPKPWWKRIFGGGETTCILSSFDGPFVTMSCVNNTSFRGIEMRHGRGNALFADHCTNLVFEACAFRNFALNGMWLDPVAHVTLRKCLFDTFGFGGMVVRTGVRERLESGDVVVTDCEFARMEMLKRTYSPAILMYGCGIRIERSHFHDMYSSAMRFEGNDFLLKDSLIEDVVLESDDQGGIDIYADPTYAGRIIGNVWRKIGRKDGVVGSCGQAAVRFDDVVSNMIVSGNRFEQCGSVGHFGAIQMNGGRNNTVDGNVFVDCPLAVSIGVRDKTNWQRYMDRNRSWQKLGKSELFATRYPGFADMYDTFVTNRLTRNVLIGEGRLIRTHFVKPDFCANTQFDKEPENLRAALAPLPLPADVAERNAR